MTRFHRRATGGHNPTPNAALETIQKGERTAVNKDNHGRHASFALSESAVVGYEIPTKLRRSSRRRMPSARLQSTGDLSVLFPTQPD